MTREIDANVEAAANIVNSVISLLRIDRDAVLAEAAKQHDADEKKGRRVGALVFHTFDGEAFMQSPYMRNHGRIMRLKAAIAYAFIRTITNNHAPDVAQKMLFETNHGISGSGWLADYIGDMLRSHERKANRRPVDAD
jgi:hypothetical protein